MKVERSFYERKTLIVAQDLLGCILIHKSEDSELSGRIVETEAYLGINDKAAHSYNCRHTPHMDPLYKMGGFAYIYQLHGYNYCFNVVTEKAGVPQAVLIRALEPLVGLELMSQNRKIDLSSGKFMNLTNGPSKLCQALDIDTSLNGIDLCGDEVFIINGDNLEMQVIETPRINIDYAEEDKNKPWRFLIKGNKFVSH
jgi:DNA-3-methyladenine glycosylase